MPHFSRLLLLAFAMLVNACSWMQVQEEKPLEPWQAAIIEKTKELGVNNWILICESSFPALNRPGIRQINAPTDVGSAADYTLQALEQTEHVRPQIFQTRELAAVEESFAPGIKDFRKKIAPSLHHYSATTLDQNALITLVQEAAKKYQVLVIRTNTALPYTTVFMQLQPGYWDGDAENQLRKKLLPQSQPNPQAQPATPSAPKATIPIIPAFLRPSPMTPPAASPSQAPSPSPTTQP